jgi:CxxC motif-containing protein (DUF1111 family)
VPLLVSAPCLNSGRREEGRMSLGFGIRREDWVTTPSSTQVFDNLLLVCFLPARGRVQTRGGEHIRGKNPQIFPTVSLTWE